MWVINAEEDAWTIDCDQHLLCCDGAGHFGGCVKEA